jgi:malate synthase
MDSGVRILGPMPRHYEAVLNPGALAFLAALHRRFERPRQELLNARRALQERLDEGWRPRFREDTESLRASEWTVGPVPADLEDRRVEITGPVDRKMMINALNSGARVFMADFEDANAPTWANVVEGQQHLIDAVAGTISHEAGGRVYRLGPHPATLVVRPRGWHLDEKHVAVDGQPLSASLMDFGLYVYHNHRRLAERHSGPYYYLPKLENHREAALWADVFGFAETWLGLKPGTIKATVLIETILAALEMEEILYALRHYVVGLNAGRWDYIFSIIKKFRHDPAAVLPDRQQVTMTQPFMRAYTDLLVRTCHRRGAHAIGGMAAFIPSRRDEEVNRVALDKVREDKEREAGDGFDGTWVAHPDLVPVARAAFDRVLEDRPHQKDRRRDDVHVRAEDLLDFHVRDGQITEAGVRNNVAVALQYLAAWLEGRGAVAIFNLMEDAATAEIARAQIWQWVRHGARLADGRPITRDLVLAITAEEEAKLRTDGDAAAFSLKAARNLFEQVALTSPMVEFLTLPAYSLLP